MANTPAPLVSVIVPVYNTGPYLDACVQSVLAQSLPAFELLLVDDGSTDGSAARCDAFAKADSRVKALHQPNAGPSRARNNGIDNAAGAYVALLDSDDTLEPDALERLYGKAEAGDFDVVSGNYTLTLPSQKQLMGHPAFEAKSHAELEPWLDSYFAKMFSLSVPAFKLMRRSLLDGLRFDEDLSIGEDLKFLCAVYAAAGRVAHVDAPVYRYMKREDDASLTSRPRLDGLEDAARIKGNVVQLFRRLGFAARAEALEADDSRLMGYSTYFYQLNHPRLGLAFGEQYRRLKELLAIPVARQKLLEKTGGASLAQSGLSAGITHFLVGRRWVWLLTLFIRLKAWLLRRKGR